MLERHSHHDTQVCARRVVHSESYAVDLNKIVINISPI